MSFRISGRDRVTGKPIPTYVSSAVSEIAARAEAGSRGIEVESIEALPTADQPGPSPAAAPVAEQPSPPRIRGGYEFTPRQNEVIAKLARYMNIAGWAGLVLGGLQVLTGFLATSRGFSNFIQGILLIIVGMLTRRVAARFRQITQSHGRDMVHLMNALTGLRTLYTF